MRPEIQKVINVVGVVAAPVAIGCMDWKYFFPVSTHSDIQFQVIGEFVELLWVLGLLLLGFWNFRKQRRKGVSAQATAGTAVLSGFMYTAILVALHWRQFFPNDQFNFLAGVDDLVIALIAGLFFTIATCAFPPKSMKPSIEDEKSVV